MFDHKRPRDQLRAILIVMFEILINAVTSNEQNITSKS